MGVKNVKINQVGVKTDKIEKNDGIIVKIESQWR